MRRAVAAAVLVLSAVLTACGGGQSTPRETLDSIRAALAAQDGARIYELHDPESRTFYRNRVREMRSRLIAGEPAREVLLDEGQTAEMFVDGTLEDAIARVVGGYSRLAANKTWLESARVVEETIDADGTRASILLRDAAGEEATWYFLLVNDLWVFDEHRHHQELVSSQVPTPDPDSR